MSWTPENAVAAPKPKSSLMPLLIVLFLVSYGLMALLVVEQGRTIDTQKGLILSLFDDSTQLSRLKGKTFQQQRAAAQAQAANKAQSQAQSPSTQETPRDNAKNNHSAGKVRKTLPEKPPVGTEDTSDVRRTLFKI